jgi:uncharacterized protein (TIGR00369 family)
MKIVYKIDPENDANPMGGMHGGRISSLVDSSTSLAFFQGKSNISLATIDMAVTYMKGIDCSKVEEILIESHVDKQGRKIAFLSCNMKNLDETILYATGRQTVAPVTVSGNSALFHKDIET